MKAESLLDFSLIDQEIVKEAISFSTTATGFAPEMIARSLSFDYPDDDFVNPVRTKLEVLGIGLFDVSDVRLADLESQLEPQLRPVLSPKRLRGF